MMKYSREYDLSVAQQMNENVRENYDFLQSSGLEINDYQFKKVFMQDRRQGKTWAMFMQLIIQIKSSGSLEVNHTIMKAMMEKEDAYPHVTKISHNMIKHNFNEFLCFIEEYFQDDFIISEAHHDNIRVEFNNARFKTTNPEYFI